MVCMHHFLLPFQPVPNFIGLCRIFLRIALLTERKDEVTHWSVQLDFGTQYKACMSCPTKTKMVTLFSNLRM